MAERDCWQRKFGYQSLFDKTAVRFGMVIDCEPIFFYYNGKTYRIELWKGQYGFNSGAEIGIYYAEGRIPPEQFASARFQSIPDGELLGMKFSLFHSGHKILEICGFHWWLTGFRIGNYCEPENLAMQLAISFPEKGMMDAFVDSLLHMGYCSCDIDVYEKTVSFVYACPHSCQPRVPAHFAARFFQWRNQLSCRLFLWVTRPFSDTLDRVMYLYFFLPIVFRRIFSYRKNRRQKFAGKKRRVHFYEL